MISAPGKAVVNWSMSVPARGVFEFGEIDVLVAVAVSIARADARQMARPALWLKADSTSARH